jgi:diketogulonate reductase-like aldo/keto reductase
MMKYEEVSGVRVPKIGFGTWSIGGKSGVDPFSDKKSLTALRSALELGYTHFDTAEIYASGHAEELLGEAIRASSIKREDLLITSKVTPMHLRYEDVFKACDRSLRRLGMDYLDIYLIHWPNPIIRLEDTFPALNKLVREAKVKHLGVSNFKLKQLKQAQKLCETPLLTDQVPYRLPDRSYADNGVLEYCQQNNILLTAYSPIKFRSIRVNSTLKAIANAHNASTFQIALAWLVAQARVITIPMSFNPVHQKENLQAAGIELSPEEMTQLNSLYSR